MTPFELDHIDDLKPQERRYDLQIEDDFVMSVLPNGIKTWVFVHEQDGRAQRRTLGVYPDMTIEMARTSLAAARATRKSLQEAMERSARASARRPEPKPVPRRRSALLPAALATAFLAVVAGAYWAWHGHGSATDAGLTELPAAVRESAPAPADAAPVPATPGSSDLPALASAGGVEDSAATESAETREPQSDTQAAVTPPAEDAPATAPDMNAAATDVGAAPIDEDTTTDAADTHAAPMAATPPPATSPDIEHADDTQPDDGEPPSLAAFSPESPAAHDPPQADERAAPKQDARVARAVLTSNVVKREPVDALGSQIQGEPGAGTQVYFYTELRGLAGETLTYRWEREGRVQAEVPLTVGKSWRWRAYSQKDIRADQSGHWRVQLVDGSAQVLAEAQFVYRNDASDSQSADAN
jgi:Protein of unknown function (DUF2914)/Arm DNA-binding domain